MLAVPDFRFSDIFSVDLQLLKKNGIKLLLLDIDNTLVPWGSREVSDELRRWVLLAGRSFELLLVSNRKMSGANAFAQDLGVKCISPAYKPSPFKIKEACGRLGYTTKESAVIGDQIVTDMLAGKLSGCTTVLVDPISEREFIGTKINRGIERFVFRRRLASAKRPESR